MSKHSININYFFFLKLLTFCGSLINGSKHLIVFSILVHKDDSSLCVMYFFFFLNNALLKSESREQLSLSSTHVPILHLFGSETNFFRNFGCKARILAAVRQKQERRNEEERKRKLRWMGVETKAERGRKKREII